MCKVKRRQSSALLLFVGAILFQTHYAKSASVPNGGHLSELESGIGKAGEDDNFLTKATKDLWGPSPLECKNTVFPLKSLVEDRKLPDDFSECKGNLNTTDLMTKLCISAVYNLRYVCQHEVQAISQDEDIPAEDMEKYKVDFENCTDLSEVAVAIPTCHNDKACNLTSEVGFELKHKDKLKPFCNACKSSEKSKYVTSI